MSQRGQSRETESKTEETLVISETEHGYRVHAPGNGKRTYMVTRDGDGFECSCGEYLRNSTTDPDWQCPHIEAVVERMTGNATNGAHNGDRYDTEERQAIQEESRPKRERKKPASNGNGLTQMVVKRSMSPDGRIDSLSVEFSSPVETSSPETIKARATEILAVQADIMQDFLGRNGKAATPSTTTQERTEPAVPARLVRIDGMDGKWGRRLFITVQVNGETTRLFGNKKQLAEALEAAGFPLASEKISEGMDLNVPCRVTTKPSPDGRFVNIDRVFSAVAPRTQARGR